LADPTEGGKRRRCNTLATATPPSSHRMEMSGRGGFAKPRVGATSEMWAQNCQEVGLSRKRGYGTEGSMKAGRKSKTSSLGTGASLLQVRASSRSSSLSLWTMRNFLLACCLLASRTALLAARVAFAAPERNRMVSMGKFSSLSVSKKMLQGLNSRQSVRRMCGGTCPDSAWDNQAE